MLNELDRAGHLKPDSKFLDLALVMVMALKWSEDQEDHEPEDFEWRNNVVAYAKKGGIDLTTVPLDNAQDLVEGVDDAEIPARVKADQWDFKKKVGRTVFPSKEKAPFGICFSRWRRF